MPTDIISKFYQILHCILLINAYNMREGDPNHGPRLETRGEVGLDDPHDGVLRGRGVLAICINSGAWGQLLRALGENTVK